MTIEKIGDNHVCAPQTPAWCGDPFIGKSGSAFQKPPPEVLPIPDYADAFATSLERIARQIRRGDVVSDLGPWVSLIGRMMERRI
jgi:hypothetical protein